MKRLVLMVFLISLPFVQLRPVAAEDCSKCHCTSYPVEKSCEKCCLVKTDRLLDAGRTFIEDLTQNPDRGVPDSIAQQASCVIVVPGRQVALKGQQYRQGLETCRIGHDWSGPVFIRVTGGSSGLQIGAPRTDLLLVATNRPSFQDLLKSKFTIGSNVEAYAGPIGRNAAADESQNMRAGLVTYSRNRDVLEGANLNGISVSQDNLDTDAFYGKHHSVEEILMGNVPAPAYSKPFLRSVAKYFHSNPLNQ